MSFSTVTLEGEFKTQKGEPAQGRLTFTLSEGMVNGTVVAPPLPVRVELDGAGHFSVALLANDDVGTLPPGTTYGVTEEIVGATPRDYFVTIAHAVNPANLASLMPGEVAWK